MVIDILVFWAAIGGAALLFAGKDILEIVSSELAGYAMLLLFGPIAWAILLVSGVGIALDKLVERWKKWQTR